MDQPGTGGTARAPLDNLENRCFRNLAIGGTFLVVGLIMTLTVVLAWWGIPLLVVGGIIVALSVMQALRRLKERGIDVKCPYCDKRYRIMPDLRHLLCDECQREIPIPRAA